MERSYPWGVAPPTLLPSWSLLEAHLPEGWRDWAKSYRILTNRRLPHNAKLKTVDEVLYLLLSYVGLGTSLRTVSAATRVTDAVPTLTSVSLHQWMRKCGPWMSQIAAAMVDPIARVPARWHGLDVIAGDGSVITQPGSKGTDARVHYALRLSDLGYVHAEVTNPTVGEKFERFPVAKDQLWLLDRNFCNPPAFAHALARKAHLLTRYNSGTLPLWTEAGEAFDVLQALGTLEAPGASASWSLVVRSGARRVAVRLLARRATEEQRQKHLERLRKDYGSKIPPRLVALAGYLLLVTTLDEKRLSTNEAFDLYRLRWQVELAIKQDKSLGELGDLPCLLPDTIHAWLVAKILLTLLVRRLAKQADQPAFPPCADADEWVDCQRPLRPTAATAPGERALASAGRCVASGASCADVGEAGGTATGTALLPGAPGAHRRAVPTQADRSVSAWAG